MKKEISWLSAGVELMVVCILLQEVSIMKGIKLGMHIFTTSIHFQRIRLSYSQNSNYSESCNVNAFSTAQRGYSTSAATTQTDRRAEYDLIARLTHRLRATAVKAKGSYPEYAQALHDNRKLWNTLAVDVADKDNGLPSQLKAQVFYLAEFTAAHTSKVIRREDSAVPLLEINTAILRGLKPVGQKG